MKWEKPEPKKTNFDVVKREAYHAALLQKSEEILTQL